MPKSGSSGTEDCTVLHHKVQSSQTSKNQPATYRFGGVKSSSPVLLPELSTLNHRPPRTANTGDCECNHPTNAHSLWGQPSKATGPCKVSHRGILSPPTPPTNVRPLCLSVHIGPLYPALLSHDKLVASPLTCLLAIYTCSQRMQYPSHTP